MAHRYYSLLRPLDIGTYPNWNGRGDNAVLAVYNFDDRTKIDGLPRGVWGYVEYEKPLTDGEMLQYDLFERAL